MHHYHLEIYSPQDARSLLDQVKANGGHAVLLSVRPDVAEVPAYVNEPYPEDAYAIQSLGPDQNVAI
jgi:hypothetical protein